VKSPATITFTPSSLWRGYPGVNVGQVFLSSVFACASPKLSSHPSGAADVGAAVVGFGGCSGVVGVGVGADVGDSIGDSVVGVPQTPPFKSTLKSVFIGFPSMPGRSLPLFDTP